MACLNVGPLTVSPTNAAAEKNAAAKGYLQR